MKSEPISGAAAISSQVAVGDKVRITRLNGTGTTLVITDLSDEGVSGKDEFIAFSEMQSAQIQHGTNEEVGEKIAFTLQVVIVIGIAVALAASGNLGAYYQ